MGARKHIRYISRGLVYMPDVLDAKTALKNFSLGGFCAKSAEFMCIAPNSKLLLDIFPEEEANVGSFAVIAESKWIRCRRGCSETGFVMDVSPGTPEEEQLRQYLEFLAATSQIAD